MIKSRNPDFLEVYKNEAKILETLSGKTPNFLIFHGSYLVEEMIMNEKFFIYTIEMEYIENSLKEDKERRENLKNPYTENELVSIFTQVVSGLNFLKMMNFMHCDIKPSNILISNDSRIKIIDFNASKAVNDATVLGTAVGS